MILSPVRVASILLTLSLTFWISGPALAFTDVEISQAALVARQIGIVSVIADDVYLGRQNDTAASAAIQAVLIDSLSQLGDGLNTSQTGDDAYRQAFSTTEVGTNLLAVIPGTDLADEYVMIGAHYDHLGTSGPDIYNGATDNAAGVAIVLAVGAAINALPTPPRRSVIFALWDAEEDGLVGSLAYVNGPLVPLASTVAYVNLDIQGANLLPSLQNTSFAIAAESGGAALQSLVQAAVARESVDTRLLTRALGQDRSDHAVLIESGVPSVFFGDATGACYHTPDDDMSVVDLRKLREQSQIAFRTTLALAEAATPPALVPPTGVVYDDAVEIADVLDGAVVDIGLFAPAQQSTLLSWQAAVRAIADAGPENFDALDAVNVLLAAEAALDALATLECDGFLSQGVPALSLLGRLGLALLVCASGYLMRNRARRMAGTDTNS
jgi:hypothetical protein